MNRQTWTAFSSLALLLLPSLSLAETALRHERLSVETPFQTDIYIQEAEEPGPTVFIIGGVHGDEPAGALAVEVIRTWPIERGTIVTVPRANPPALEAGKRLIPGESSAVSNLNRDFPRPDDPAGTRPDYAPALEFWELAERFSPDWVLDLHEGFDIHQRNSNSVGRSVIADKDPETQAMAELLLETVNRDIEDAETHFVKLGPPVSGSFARACSEHLGSHAMILETTTKGDRQPVRARQHRKMVAAFLEKLEMIHSDVSATTFLSHLHDTDVRLVGLYDDGGIAGAGVPNLEKQLGAREDLRVLRVDAEDIRAGSCKGFDILIFSGGSGSGQARSLGDEGRDWVREFVEQGGTYIGICAGAYLAGSGFSWDLDLLNVKTRSSRWRRGRGDVSVNWTEAGRILFDREAEIGQLIRYANGPIWEPAGREDLPEPEVLAVFRTELAENNTPKGLMVNTPAILQGTYGAGQVFSFSPHPEQTEGCLDLVERALDSALVSQ